MTEVRRLVADPRQRAAWRAYFKKLRAKQEWVRGEGERWGESNEVSEERAIRVMGEESDDGS